MWNIYLVFIYTSETYKNTSVNVSKTCINSATQIIYKYVHLGAHNSQ